MPAPKLTRYIDITGKRFGRLVAVKMARIEDMRAVWLMKCDCGALCEVQGKHVRNGNTRSCGCLALETRRINNMTHGLSGQPEYQTWKRMRRRCLNKKSKDYYLYGARGISISPSWSKFEYFYRDMGARPSPIHSIDRINVNGNYEHENCRWATPTQQANNRRNNIKNRTS